MFEEEKRGINWEKERESWACSVIEEAGLYERSKSFSRSKMKDLSMSIWWLKGNILCYDVSIDSSDLSQWLVQRWSNVVWSIESMDVSQCVSVFGEPSNTRVMRIFYTLGTVCVCVSFILVPLSRNMKESVSDNRLFFLSFFLCYRQYIRAHFGLLEFFVRFSFYSTYTRKIDINRQRSRSISHWIALKHKEKSIIQKNIPLLHRFFFYFFSCFDHNDPSKEYFVRDHSYDLMNRYFYNHLD